MSLFGPADLAAGNPADFLVLADPFLDIAGAIPILNIFIGNGADGTALHPDGFNGGIFMAAAATATAHPHPAPTAATAAMPGGSSVMVALAATAPTASR